MKVESVAISSLREDSNNARRHDERNLAAIKGSLKAFGQQKNIVVTADGVVVAGNGTLAAARELGWTEIMVARTTLEDEQLKAFALADNRTSELASWDQEILSNTLRHLDEHGIDIAQIGFDDFDFSVPPKEGLTDPDELPEHVEPRTKPGDLYVLGRHRVLCGDSTNVLDVERLMAGEKADMVFTDPPYGVSERTARGSSGRGCLAQNQDFRPVIGDETNQTALDTWTLCQSAYPKASQIWWGANYYCSALPEVSSWLVWDKRDGVRSDDNADCEMAWCSNRKPARVFAHLWKGCIRASEKAESKTHPTQKPVALAQWCFENYGNPKTVLDLFLGSGSTLIACEKTGRRCFGMEIDPHYCDVIVERWERFTGEKATLLSV